jgi:hypothetical protein
LSKFMKEVTLALLLLSKFTFPLVTRTTCIYPTQFCKGKKKKNNVCSFLEFLIPRFIGKDIPTKCSLNICLNMCDTWIFHNVPIKCLAWRSMISPNKNELYYIQRRT